MKAAPNAAILQLFRGAGLQIDASSGYEARQAMASGYPADAISLSSQELPVDFDQLHGAGVAINACSLHQLERFGAAFPVGEIGLRFNPVRVPAGTIERMWAGRLPVLESGTSGLITCVCWWLVTI